MASVEKEEGILLRRLIELSRLADRRYSNTFTSFLNMNEISIFYENVREYEDVPFSLFGGWPDAERKIVCFHGGTLPNEYTPIHGSRNEISISKESAVMEYPIACVHIAPVNHKFSDDLSHRDFLGAILHLGIDRSRIGDILLKENEGYVFCEETIAHFITDSLTNIKHTNIKCECIDYGDIDISPNFLTIHGTVSSTRLDTVIATAFQCSRSSIGGLITGGKVFVNGRESISSSLQLKENDVVSVRGKGKFIYAGSSHITKKGRYSITVKRYN